MGAFKNIGLNGYFKRYGYRYGLLRAVFMANPIHLVKNYENKKILYYGKAKRYLEKKYIKFAEVDPEGLSFGDIRVNNPIWVYWKQGIENAPLLVQKCVESVKNSSSRPVILLDSNLVQEYVGLPASILKKYSDGNMSDAALSDLVRFSLLEHYGGTWMDATVFMTGDLPEYISNADFFAFKDTFGLIQNPALISNWLLHCKKGNVVMRATRNMSFAYWMNENYVVDYLFTYMILNICVEHNKTLIGNYPYANSDYSHLLLECIDEKFDDDKMKHIMELSTVQKLTYKLKKESFEQHGTFLKYVLGEYNGDDC